MKLWAKVAQTTPREPSRDPYVEFEKLDGRHSFKDSVPEGRVEYQVRTRRGGHVVFFNYPLAKEMGLIPSDHPESMNDKLERKLLETFSLVIINEYDIAHKIQFDPRDIRPHRYMATRYLQLQHRNKQGKTSGDGRGIWNGEFRGQGGVTWDVTSSGTGATCLSPAAAQTGRNFRTGDKRVGYGNGYNTLDEGLSAALMSEIFHQNGTPTERTLLIIGFAGDEKGTSINIRAGRNLLRPSHFFCHLKQGRLDSLRATVDYFIARQTSNGDYPKHLRGEAKYRFFSEEVARAFARTAARFESEYIFCWMDWDGDNILSDGGIIDYGSIRQFGMFYGDYRYDDVSRYSTSLPEQRIKARHIVQCFAQIRDFILKGRKRNLRRYRNDPTLAIFDQEFEKAYLEALLDKTGISPKIRANLMKEHLDLVKGYRRAYQYFERVQSAKGIYSVPDGLNRDAVFSMREFLREYPRQIFNKNPSVPLSAEALIDLMASRSARPSDLKIKPFREQRAKELQQLYGRLIAACAGDALDSPRGRKTLLEVMMRSSVINKPDRITGDSAILITENLIRWYPRMTRRMLHEAFRALVAHQHFRPRERKTPLEESTPTVRRSKKQAWVDRNLKLIRKYRESL